MSEPQSWCPDCRQATSGRCGVHAQQWTVDAGVVLDGRTLLATGGYVPSVEDDLRAQLTAAQNEIVVLEATVDRLRTERGILHTELDTLRAERDRLQQEKDDAECRHADASDNAQMHYEIASAAKAKLAALQAGIAKVEEEMRDYPHITAEFHSGDREPGTLAEGVARKRVAEWADRLRALRSET
jgi:chromosome segregation ATPase